MVPQPYMAPDATALNANGCKTIPFEVWLLVLTLLKNECIFAKLDYFIVVCTLTKYKVSKNKAIIGILGCYETILCHKGMSITDPRSLKSDQGTQIIFVPLMVLSTAQKKHIYWLD